MTSPAVTHAFVVGVSHYPFLDGPQMTPTGEQLGMANLSSAARSASEVAAWLLNEYRCPEAPLKDVRLLLSPVDGEQLHADVRRPDGRPGRARHPRERSRTSSRRSRRPARTTPPTAPSCSWPATASSSARGAPSCCWRTSRPAEEDDLLFGAIDVMGCHAAMRGAGGADHQVWFSDACRQRPEIVRRFETLTGAFAPGNVGLGEVAASPVFLSSSTRENAFADPQGLTIFTQALLWALRGAAAVGKDETCPGWHVSSTRLSQVLPARVKDAVPGRRRRPVGRPDRASRSTSSCSSSSRRRRSTSRSP